MTDLHRKHISRATEEQTGSEPEVAGHATKWGAIEGDDDGTEVAGHLSKWGAVPTDLQPADDDDTEVEGHGAKCNC